MRTQLLWKVDLMTPAPCPDAPKRDPYTGEYPSVMIGCLVAHFKTETREMDKSFPTEEEADAFMAAAPKNCYGWVKRPL
jgi:hypothetical protein